MEKVRCISFIQSERKRVNFSVDKKSQFLNKNCDFLINPIRTIAISQFMKKNSFSPSMQADDIINIKIRLKRRKKKFSKKHIPKIRANKSRNSMKRIKTRCRTINWVPLFNYLTQLDDEIPHLPE